MREGCAQVGWAKLGGFAWAFADASSSASADDEAMARQEATEVGRGGAARELNR